MRLSPSQISLFDDSTAFGCNRKWWFKYIGGIETPGDASQDLGKEIHKSIEDFVLGKGDVNCLHPIAMPAANLIREVKNWGGNKEVEMKIELGQLELWGHQVTGQIDYLNDKPRLIDWKTTSNIKRYAKTEEQVAKDIQTNIYGKYFYNQTGSKAPLETSLVYMQTRGSAKFQEVSTVLTEKSIDQVLTSFEPIIKSMELAAKSPVEEVKGDTEKCRIGKGGCPYFSICPKAGGDIMSLFDKFRAAAKPVEAVLPAVLPPDAPQSKPELAADTLGQSQATQETTPPPPVTSAPVSEAAHLNVPAPVPQKRGPGRPRKTVSEPTATVAHVQPEMQTREVVSVVKNQITSTTLRHSLTINLGNYESAKVEVERTIEGDDLKKLSAMVQEDLKTEIEPYRRLQEARAKPKEVKV